MLRSLGFLVLVLSMGCGSEKPPSPPIAADPNLVVIKPSAVSSGLELVQRYPTKTVEVSGIIEHVGTYRELESESAVLFKTQAVVGLMCPIREPEVWAKIVPGQTVTLHGRKFDETEFAWEIFKAEPNPCPTLASAAFAKEFEDAPGKSHDKYNNNSFYLTGNVIAIEPWQTYHFLIKLEGSRDWKIDLQVNLEFAAIVKKIKPGQTISALCTYSDAYFKPEVHTLELDAYPITIEFPASGIEYRKSLPSR